MLYLHENRAKEALQLFGDWTDRIARGELPRSSPPRPQGVAHSILVTLWDSGDAKTYVHDEIATDKLNPTVNAYGKLYGTPEYSTDFIPILDVQKATGASAVTRPPLPRRASLLLRLAILSNVGRIVLLPRAKRE